MSGDGHTSPKADALAGNRLSSDIDDAFEDCGDDDSTSLELDSAAIRKQLQENYAQDGQEHAETEAGSSVHGQDTSVSTFYLDGSTSGDPNSRPLSSLAHSPGGPYTPDEFNIDFSKISLSEDPAEVAQEDDSLDAKEEPLEHEQTVGDHDPRASLASELTTSGSEDRAGSPIRFATESEEERSISSDDVTSLPREEEKREPPPQHPSDSQPETPGAADSTKHSYSLSQPPPSKTSSSSVPRPKPTRSAGPSALQKVVSRTRPPFLPPKDKREDEKHLQDWETMMALSRVAEEKRRKALQERRAAREARIEQSIPMWQKEIMPDWRVVNKNPSLRKLWWNGIPAKLRADLWQRAVGNPLALSQSNYVTCLARAKRALTSGVFPADTLASMEEDIITTLPALHIFHPDTGPLYQDLKDMLCAWVVSRADEGLGYTHGAAKIAAMFLLNMAPPQAFTTMRNLLERHCIRSFYGGSASNDDVYR